jgi:hypothetical protein
VLPDLQTPVRSATVLATGEHLKVTKMPDGTLAIAKPAQVDKFSTAIALRLVAAPVVIQHEVLVSPSRIGRYELGTLDAVLEGSQIQAEHEPANIGYWTNQSDSVHWPVNTPATAAGSYLVSLKYACEAGTEGSTFSILVDGTPSGVVGTVASTGGWYEYRQMTLPGSLNLAAGRHSIKIVATKKPGFAVMNLRSITLTPQR